MKNINVEVETVEIETAIIAVKTAMRVENPYCNEIGVVLCGDGYNEPAIQFTRTQAGELAVKEVMSAFYCDYKTAAFAVQYAAKARRMEVEDGEILGLPSDEEVYTKLAYATR